MVMATGSVCQQFSGGELTREAGEATDYASAEAAALHERLVAYVHALAGGHEPRSGVWVEHSYARARGAPHAPAAHVRVLLAPRLSVEHGDVDVERVEPPPPELPADRSPERDHSDSEHDDDWEARVTALAPSAVHARLAEHALDTLRRMRLERLAGARGSAGDAAARTAARRLRLALASAAAHPAAHAQRPGAWLHATLHAYMPRAERRLYDDLASELRRAAPRLAERAMGGRAPPPRRDPLAAVGPALGCDSSPWLVWLGCGRARLDARWARRLGALVYTRVLGGAGGAGGAAPDAWCAAVAGSVRAALADTLVEAGERPVILGGIGAGAALVTALAGATGVGAGAAGAGAAARVRGLLLLAPPLLTAEGARDTPDDVLAEVRLPMLVVAGTGAAACWRGAAREVTRARGEGGARRVLELRGADDALRLPAEHRRRRRLPQHALDAAVAEECARWAIETATSATDECHTSPARDRARRRDARAGRAERAGADDEEDYAHLPSAGRPAPSAALAVPSAGSDRPTETVGESSGRRRAGSSLEAPHASRVVSRGSGATPLALEAPLAGRMVSRGSGATPLALEVPHAGRMVSRGSGATPLALEAPHAGRVVSRGSGATPLALEAPHAGRMVSRVSGATPLALLPLRRRAPSPPAPAAPPAPLAPLAPPAAPALQVADIMRLPIVFADDVPALDEPAASSVTVTSGSRGYTRVIVASRGGPHGSARGLRPGPGRPGSHVRPSPAVRPGRPVLLRRGLRLLSRADRPH